MISSNTRLAAIIGSPVAQSLSPVIHNAVFEAKNLDWLYVAFLVNSSRVRDALSAMSALGIGGFSVTMPHKNEVAKIVGEIGEVDEIVKLTKSANTVVLRADNSLWATNTDGDGCCNALEEAMQSTVKGERVVILGAGGTASAVAYVLAQRGASEVVIINRSVDRAQDLVKQIGGVVRVANSTSIAKEISNAQIIINTTPVGFGDIGENTKTPIDISLIRSSHVVLDAVYNPLQTGLIVAATNAGAVVVDGLSMLVHQAVLQQQHWISERYKSTDIALMRNAALSHLASIR